MSPTVVILLCVARFNVSCKELSLVYCFWRPLWVKSDTSSTAWLGVGKIFIWLVWEANERKMQHIFDNTFFFFEHSKMVATRSCIFLWLCVINNCNMMMMKQIKRSVEVVFINVSLRTPAANSFCCSLQ